MSNEYNPSNPGQPPSGGGMPPNYGPPGGGPPPYGSPPPGGPPPGYGQPGAYGQPSGPGSYGPPPGPPYGAPPPGPGYGPPPGGPPYGMPQQPITPKKRSNKLLFGILGGVVALLAACAVLALLVGGPNVPAADYPGATKAELSDTGATYVNRLYTDGKSNTGDRKVFLTADKPDAVFSFYRTQLEKDGWTFEQAGVLSGMAAQSYKKDKKQVFIVAEPGSKGLVKSAAADQTFIILVAGATT